MRWVLFSLSVMALHAFTVSVMLRPMSCWSSRTERWPSWWILKKIMSVVFFSVRLPVSKKDRLSNARTVSHLFLWMTICWDALSIPLAKLLMVMETSIWPEHLRCHLTVKRQALSIVNRWKNHYRQAWKLSIQWFLSVEDSVNWLSAIGKRVKRLLPLMPSLIKKVSMKPVNRYIVSM